MPKRGDDGELLLDMDLSPFAYCNDSLDGREGWFRFGKH